MTRRPRFANLPLFETLVILVSLVLLGAISFAIWQFASGRIEIQLFPVVGKALLTGKVLKVVAAGLVAAGLIVVTAIVVGLRRHLRRGPEPEALDAGPVEIPQQQDLGPVMDHLPVNMEKKSSHG